MTVFNFMHLYSGSTACLSAVLFNACIILAMVPMAIKGVRYVPMGAGKLFRRNLSVWGVLGLTVPFVGIKGIDMFLSWFV